jgi:hypothetical protein
MKPRDFPWLFLFWKPPQFAEAVVIRGRAVSNRSLNGDLRWRPETVA